MALHQVSTTGLNQDLFSNCTRVGIVFMWYALFAKQQAWRGVRDALVSAEISGWHVVSRGEGGYPQRGIK